MVEVRPVAISSPGCRRAAFEHRALQDEIVADRRARAARRSGSAVGTRIDERLAQRGVGEIPVEVARLVPARGGVGRPRRRRAAGSPACPGGSPAPRVLEEPWKKIIQPRSTSRGATAAISQSSTATGAKSRHSTLPMRESPQLSRDPPRARASARRARRTAARSPGSVGRAAPSRSTPAGSATWRRSGVARAASSSRKACSASVASTAWMPPAISTRVPAAFACSAGAGLGEPAPEHVRQHVRRHDAVDPLHHEERRSRAAPGRARTSGPRDRHVAALADEAHRPRPGARGRSAGTPGIASSGRQAQDERRPDSSGRRRSSLGVEQDRLARHPGGSRAFADGAHSDASRARALAPASERAVREAPRGSRVDVRGRLLLVFEAIASRSRFRPGSPRSRAPLGPRTLRSCSPPQARLGGASHAATGSSTGSGGMMLGAPRS